MKDMADTAPFQNIPAELQACPQWVCWRREDRLGKMTKVPYSAHTGNTKRLASSTNPATWASFIEVVSYYRAHQSLFDGIGFVVTDADPYVGVDLDHVIDLDTGAMDAWAVNILSRLHSYSEVSPSGTGVRIFVKGSLPAGGRKSGPFEIYESGRYLTVTGNIIDCGGGAWCLDNEAGRHNLPYIAERTAVLAAIHEEVFGKPEPTTATKRPAPGLMLSDRDLLDHAMSAANGAAFRSLWEGQRSAYQSDSESDLALCSHLLFWAGGDAHEAGRLFQLSGLMRDKWNERHRGDGTTYGEMTIARALASMTDFYSGAPAVGAAPTGPAFMSNPSDMVEEFFRGY
jgi:putative DNA primase/helicase